jgi:hypothetical protein
LTVSDRREAQYYLDGWRAFRAAAQRGATADFFSASKWAVADADLLDRDPSDAAVPAQMRAFLTSNQQGRRVSKFVQYANV